MKNVLFFVLLGTLLTFTVAEELEDILMSNEDEDISGVGAAVLVCFQMFTVRDSQFHFHAYFSCVDCFVNLLPNSNSNNVSRPM